MKLKLNKAEMIRHMQTYVPKYTKGMWNWKTSDVREVYLAFEKAQCKAIAKAIHKKMDRRYYIKKKNYEVQKNDEDW